MESSAWDTLHRRKKAAPVEYAVRVSFSLWVLGKFLFPDLFVLAIVDKGRFFYYNTALSSAKSSSGGAVVTREADIVTAHGKYRWLFRNSRPGF